MFDLGPPPSRSRVDAALVRRLVAEQFPHWAELPLRPVTNQGWDNTTFRLGEQMLVRLPTAAEYALAVTKEHRWLPQLAPQLPVPVPVPLAQGAPSTAFPHPWSVYVWLEGEPASRSAITDLNTFAGDLAGLLTALRSVDPEAGPGPGTHNWFRGGPLSTFEPLYTGALTTLADHVDTAAVHHTWQTALQAPWDQRPVWFHGDMAPGNLLLRRGRLVAVIDFGTCGVGDPACDLAIAWTLLSGQSREIFRDRLDVDTNTWARGRGWALWKTLVSYAAGVDEDSAGRAEDQRVLAEILADPISG